MHGSVNRRGIGSTSIAATPPNGNGNLHEHTPQNFQYEWKRTRGNEYRRCRSYQRDYNTSGTDEGIVAPALVSITCRDPGKILSVGSIAPDIDGAGVTCSGLILRIKQVVHTGYSRLLSYHHYVTLLPHLYDTCVTL